MATGMLVGRLCAVSDFNAAQVELWDRYLATQRSWEQDWLHWVEYEDGWHLDGSVLPAGRP